MTAACVAGLSTAAGAVTIQEVTSAGEERAAAAAADQQRIDQVANQIEKLVIDFETEAKVVDGLKVYNNLLQRQIDNQETEKSALAESIDNVALIERQIVPLMTRMLDSLEEFVALDTPFLKEERTDRIARLRDMMERSDVTAAEKLRQILEAYSIENEYGRTIEAYKGSLEVAGRMQEVDFLRVGRVSLTYQTVGGNNTGAWNHNTNEWVELPPQTYKTQIAEGLRIARKQIAPDLFVVPVAAPEEVGQ
ncbi:MAG: DUF3450 domain-containing protein [Gammaproteobacteria bacterium]